MVSRNLTLGAIGLAVLIPIALTQSMEAPVVTNNIPGVQYVAQFPVNNTNPSGAVVISSTPDGDGVNVQVSISNLPGQGGPFREFHMPSDPLVSTPDMQQSTTFMNSPSLQTVTATRLAGTSIPTTSPTSLSVIPHSRKIARWEISRASMAQ